MTIHLENVVALVTGASGGIGNSVCAALTKAGARVVATDLVAPETGNAPDAEAFLAHDVTSQSDWENVANHISDNYGRLDALVNVAGLSVVSSIEATDLDAWRKVFAVNVESMLIGHQVMLPLLKKGGEARQSGASIVNFSSIAGQRGAAFNAAYCSSKGAVKIFSKSAAIEFAALGYNIRVNTIHPGGVDTPMLDSIIQTYLDLGVISSAEEAQQGIIADHPIGRLGVGDDLGGGVVYLCSEAAAFVTGSELNIDGGFSAV
ncbi:MAG: SDR family NAD(P)-dependent oxidoreductase [Parvibaculales bacterium]